LDWKFKKPDFIIIPIQVADDPTLNAIDAKLFGYIYWFTKLRLEKCIASNRLLADLVGTTPNTIQHALERLERSGWVTRIFYTPDKKIRLEIKCNVQFEREVLSVDNRVLPTDNTGVLSTDNHNKNIYKKNNRKRTSTNVLEQALDKRDTTIEICLNHWEQTFKKRPTGKPTITRYPFKRLVAAYTLEKVLGAITYMGDHMSDRYMPGINNPKDLEDKWLQLVKQAKQQQGNGVVEI
jgi:hypothetical protein